MAEIKIYGTLVNMTTDQKLALTRQLYDETLEKFQDIINKETEDNINTINESISSITSNLETIVVDNLTSDDTTKALSAKQGKVLKSLIDAIKSFSIIVLQEGEDLPETGNPNTIYFKKKEGSDKDIYNEYIYIETA
jgi:flavorubredoxin